MKCLTKTRFLIFSITAILLAASPFSSFAEGKELSEQEFVRISEENHAGQSRRLHPPLKDPASDPFNYEFMKDYRNLAAGQIIMDMEDGYEIRMSIKYRA